MAAFAVGEAPIALDLPLSSVGARPGAGVTDLWTGLELGRPEHSIALKLPAHASVLLRLEP